MYKKWVQIQNGIYNLTPALGHPESIPSAAVEN